MGLHLVAGILLVVRRNVRVIEVFVLILASGGITAAHTVATALEAVTTLTAA